MPTQQYQAAIADRWVYFIGMEEADYVKIGKTHGRPHTRLKELQTGNPFELKVLAAVATPDAGLLERSLHQRFADHRHRGEWFRRAPELDKFIERYADAVCGCPVCASERDLYCTACRTVVYRHDLLMVTETEHVVCFDCSRRLVLSDNEQTSQLVITSRWHFGPNDLEPMNAA